MAKDGLCVCVSVCLCVCVSLQGLQGSTLCAKIILFILIMFLRLRIIIVLLLIIITIKESRAGGARVSRPPCNRVPEGVGKRVGGREKDVGTRAACAFP